mgnify:CR=1 FL=1
MKYYLSITTVFLDSDGRVDGNEVVLTRPDSLEATKNMHGKMKRLGMENLHVVKHKAKRYNKLIREQNKRHRERKMTKAEVAEIMADDS